MRLRLVCSPFSGLVVLYPGQALVSSCKKPEDSLYGVVIITGCARFPSSPALLRQRLDRLPSDSVKALEWPPQEAGRRRPVSFVVIPLQRGAD